MCIIAFDKASGVIISPNGSLSGLLIGDKPVGLFGQATKGAWWMPWGKGPMKDAASGDTLR